ncbi:MAG: ribosome biogenesis GTPase Der [Holdemanella biformis]|nr:ribosome biogenesis GTPase Der [Holdemanella biformis]
MIRGTVAIVGRPNVGKSTIFNRLIGQRKSIVDDTPGVTRDRIYGEVEWLTQTFRLIDTGGIQIEDQAFAQEINMQVDIAIEEADVIIFLTSAKEGVMTDDTVIARKLQKCKKPVILACNKVDNPEMQMNVYEFYALGLGDPVVLSGAHGIGLGDLLDIVMEKLPEKNLSPYEGITSFCVIGRPNVGKSTLFNALAGERISIVKDTPGVTRDRIYADVSWLDYNFTMIDTGGIEPESGDVILSQMREQAQIAIDTADVIIFITDVKQGLVDSDSKVADMLRRSHKPVVLVVNKVDSFEKYMTDVYEFYNLGIGDPHPISAASMLGLGDMLDEVVKHFPDSSKQDDEDDRPRVAIVGKPNVGKSSLINKLAREDRVIVSDIAGTTRDAIDTAIKYDGKEYIFIDTAGLRRKNKIKEDIERYSIIRAVSAVERADVVIVVIDATEGVTEQDAKIAGIAHERGKGIIIAVNKWDAIEKDNNTVKQHTEKIRQILSFIPYAEILFISAKSGQRLNKIFELIDVVIENNSMRVATGVLNEIVTEAVAMQQPPTDKGKRLKIYYVTQVSVKPPTFVIFVNDKNLMHFSYTRYLENRIRDTFGFRGTALKFITRERKENE